MSFPTPNPDSFRDGEDPVVIIGMACRYGGEASSVTGFWDMIKNARSAHSKIPSNRFNIDAYYHPSPDRQGSINTQSGYFIKQDPAAFDAPFFSMTATEAAGMDPMQRQMLEVAYEGIENAGIPMHKLAGSKTSVYVGCFTKDYEELSSRDIYNTNFYQSTGNGRSMLSNRVSWFFDLRAPSLSLDTACSSSLYALHLACQSLKTGESTMSIVGGTNLVLSPDLMRALTAMRFLSPDGKCHSFDSRANGYARGEGFGAVILKRLSQAIADGDTIRAVLRATGLNQDGKTPGITMPGAEAQADLIRSCYAEAKLPYHQTAYFEAHGTGTAIGDPIELSALASTFGVDRNPEAPLYVGSAKTNVGHLEGCAGLAGLMRAVLGVEKGMIPPLADFEKPNPMLKLDAWRVVLPTQAIPWPVPGIRRASVNSFGYGGANSHAIVDDAYHYLQARGLEGKHQTTLDAQESDVDSGFGSGTLTPTSDSSVSSGTKPKLFVFSALDQAALQRLSGAYAKHLQDQLDKSKQLDGLQLVDLHELSENLSYTLSHRRSLFDHRTHVVADGIADLTQQLHSRVAKSRRSEKPKGIVFIFTGQGAQWASMGVGLMSYDQFRCSIELADACLKSIGCPWSLIDELSKDEKTSCINSPDFSQPLCTALQLAQVDLLKSWGIEASAVVGHSSGEIAAAYAAGTLSHQDAVKIAYYRGILSADVNRRDPTYSGSMLAVGLSPQNIEPYLAKSTFPSVVVACINSPESVTLSGKTQELVELENLLSSENVFARKLKVKTAYHSPQMNLVADDYLQALKDIKTQTSGSEVVMYSSVTTAQTKSSELGPSYWVRNMVQPVRFSDAVNALLTQTSPKNRRRRAAGTYSAIIEIGPHEALKGPLNQILSNIDAKLIANITYNSLLVRGKDAQKTTLQAVGNLWTQGYTIDLLQVNDQESALTQLTSLVDLPSYPWNHSKTYWHEMHTSIGRRSMKKPRTDLLGVIIEGDNPLEPRWRNVIRTLENPWLLDHKVQEAVLFPGAAMLTMVLEAAQTMAEPGRVVKGYEIRDVNFTRGLVVPGANEVLETQLHVRPHKIGTKASTAPWYHFAVVSLLEGGSWVEHCSGLFTILYQKDVNEVDRGFEASVDWKTKTAMYGDFKKRCTTSLKCKSFYKKLETIGLHYGPSFQNIVDCSVAVDMSHGTVVIPDTKSIMPYKYEYAHLIHPATLDSMFQMLLAAMVENGDLNESMVPVGIKHLFIASDLPTGAGSKFIGYAHGHKQGVREAIGHIVLSDEEWKEPKVIVEDFVSMRLSAATGGVAALETGSVIRKRCTQLHWMEDINHLSGDKGMKVLMSERFTESQEVSDDHFLNAFRTTIAQVIADAASLDTSTVTPHATNYLHWLQQHSSLLEEYCSRKYASEVFSTSSDLLEKHKELLSNFSANFSKLLTDEIEMDQIMTQDLLDVVYEATARELDTLNVQLTAWLDRACHKNPDLNVLVLGDGSRGSTLHVVRCFAAHGRASARFGHCTLAEKTDDIVANLQRRMKSDKLKLDYKTLNLEVSTDKQDFTPETFDLIITSPQIQRGVSVEAGLSSLKPLLKPTGKLLVSGFRSTPMTAVVFRGLSEQWWIDNNVLPAGIEMDKHSWQSNLHQAGFTGTELFIESTSQSILLTSSITAPATSAGQSKEVVLLNGNGSNADTNALLENLTAKFVQTGFTVGFAGIEDADSMEGKTVISLIELSDEFIRGWNGEQFESFRRLFNLAARLLWITRGAQPMGDVSLGVSSSTGLLRTLRAESPQTLLAHLDISMRANLSADDITSIVYDAFVDSVLTERSDREMELAELDGKLFIPRLLEDASFDHELEIPNMKEAPVQEPLVQAGRPLRLAIGTPGMIDSLRWVDDLETFAPMQPDEVEIQTTAASLNFVDIMAAMGQIPTSTVGCEVAGVVLRVGSNVTRFRQGQTVIATKTNAFRTHVRQDQCLVQEVPETMDPAVAASCPTIYMTAYAGLIDSARLLKGESILIHAAAGGLGQAAVQVAMSIGAEIFATVGSTAKKELLMKHYAIPEDHIFSSRDLTFAKGVMRMTKGKGVDVVLNCLSGEALRQTWLCIADFGRFVEVGKKDIVGNTGLDMSPFMRHVTFTSVNMEYMEKVRRPMVANIMQKSFDLIRQGVVGEVFPTTRYSFSETEKAFRLMQTGKHSGKIVLCVNPNDVVPVLPRKPAKVELDSKATYVLSGGLGGIGRSIGEMMFSRGARHIVFLSRSGASKPEAQHFLAKLEARGCRAEALSCDISNNTQVERFAKKCQEEDLKIKGLVQCAMVLQDSTFENMTFEKWETAIRPKVQGTESLHRFLPRDMDFFIMLSSMSGIIGHPGQANYAAGNTYQDALAHHRRSQGLAATCIDLGVVSDVGYIAENVEQFEKFDHLSSLHISEQDLHTLLSAAMLGHTADGRPVPPQLVTGIGRDLLKDSTMGTAWSNDPKFSHLKRADGTEDRMANSENDELKQTLSSATTLREAGKAIEEALVAKLAKALIIEAEEVDTERPLHAYGVDSLVAVEIRNWMFRELKSDISVFDILSPTPLAKLSLKIAAKSQLVPSELAAELNEEGGGGGPAAA